MTDKDKQRIARLVAEKVWGWDDLPPQGNAYADEYTLSQVFSWPGFGRTVERMLGGFKINIHEVDIPKSFGVQFTQRENMTFGYCISPQEDGIILTTHLAALDALGIDWRTDND